jgi:F-type H+-transporting ATPase subunit b
MLEPEFWVAVAFVLFCGLLGYLGAHRKVIEALDQRQARISAELGEARRLKEEAQNLLEQYGRKQREVEGEAQAIIVGAKMEAERLAAEAETKLEKFIELRTKLADTKIAQAEAQALADVRAAAAEAAVGAAGRILVKLAPNATDRLIDRSITEMKNKLN